MTFNTPVLLIAWRRPHTTQQVIDAIRVSAPTKLFVACDGPNPERPDEAEKVAATRAVIEKSIDWPCQVERLYSDTNQGCRLGVSRAITWFFEQIEEGIILEDDCVPHPDFFLYCAELLERYRHDTRIWCISGDNSADIKFFEKYSYGFIKYPLIWGWATWRRCWKEYDFNFSFLSLVTESPTYLKSFFGENESLAKSKIEYWNSISSDKNPIDTWDAAWAFTCLSNSGLTILPNQNLIKNIGFGNDATHTFDSHNLRSSKSTIMILPLIHPPRVIRDYNAEKKFEQSVYNI